MHPVQMRTRGMSEAYKMVVEVMLLARRGHGVPISLTEYDSLSCLVNKFVVLMRSERCYEVLVRCLD